MKKIIYIVCLFAYISQSKAQLLNSKFEDWAFVKVFYGRDDTLWSPKNWTVYNNCADDDYYGNKLTKTFGIEGKFGIGLSTLVCGISGYAKPTYLVYGNHDQKSTNNTKSWGVPYSNKLHSVGGKFNFTNERFISDSGYAQVILTKYNIKKFKSDTIGFGNISFPVSLNKNILKPFEIKINYRDATIVGDTMILVFQSSKAFLNDNSEISNGALTLDSLYLSEDLLSVESENALSKAITLYPNPTTTQLHISNASAFTKFIIYQSNGIKVLETPASEHLDVSALHEGLYLLELWDMRSKKVLKKFEKR